MFFAWWSRRAGRCIDDETNIACFGSLGVARERLCQAKKRSLSRRRRSFQTEPGQRLFFVESDQELIELANRGDFEAFGILYHRYRDWVYRLAWRFTGNRQDALDVLQETFAYLLGKFPGFELTAAMTTFLYPVVKHLSLALRRKNRRFVSDDEALSKLTAPVSQDTERSRCELAGVLAALPEAQREILLMRFVDGMSLQEIAETLNIPLGTVKSRLHHALRALRDDRRTRDYFLG
ncbi:MAG: RNA polymerase sigma factor [Phycisphaerae bacterium]|nr:RNA polymerase sigma factor [Phycisphaerae bacterium]